MDYFGLKGVELSWVSAFFGQLVALSKEKISSLRVDGRKRKIWRIHDVKWKTKNIPIQKKDLTLIPERYRDNDDDYPFIQISISKALGRFIGFFDDSNVFNIVLVDPMHNIYPCEYNGYKVRECSEEPTDYVMLLEKFDQLGKSTCENADCGFRRKLQELKSQKMNNNIIMHFVDDDNLALANKYIESDENDDVSSYSEIFKYGLEFLKGL